MNQILVTEKIYVTPELKRKKRMYKRLSIFIIITLFSIYIYAEYDRYRDEDISRDILSVITENDNNIVREQENALVVLVTQEENGIEDDEYSTPTQMTTATSTYEAPNGKTYEYIGRIIIPKINVDYPILSKTTVELLRVSPCKFHGGNPNEVGNLCIAGHNYRNKRFFSKVPTLIVGDIVEIEDLSKRKVQYEVYDIHTVLPNNRNDTTQKTNGKKEVTLITCTDDSKQRVIVKCTEKL